MELIAVCSRRYRRLLQPLLLFPSTLSNKHHEPALSTVQRRGLDFCLVHWEVGGKKLPFITQHLHHSTSLVRHH